MARDIEEFLRKAAERRAQQKSGQKPGQNPNQRPQTPNPPRQQTRRQSEPVIIDQVEVVQPKRETLKAKLKEKKDQKDRKDQQRQQAKDMRRQSVSEHVSSHIDTSGVTRIASKLGDRIASVHDQVDARVHEHLDHDISRVDDNPTITDDMESEIFGKAKPVMANKLRAMLADPDAVGNAIILAEILKRPDFEDE
jgi:type IV secretory pathway VirB10-like protein